MQLKSIYVLLALSSGCAVDTIDDRSLELESAGEVIDTTVVCRAHFDSAWADLKPDAPIGGHWTHSGSQSDGTCRVYAECNATILCGSTLTRVETLYSPDASHRDCDRNKMPWGCDDAARYPDLARGDRVQEQAVLFGVRRSVPCSAIQPPRAWEDGPSSAPTSVDGVDPTELCTEAAYDDNLFPWLSYCDPAPEDGRVDSERPGYCATGRGKISEESDASWL